MRNLIFEAKQSVIQVCRLFYSFLSGGVECAVCGSLVFTGPVCRKCQKKYFSVKNALMIKRCVCCGRTLFSENEKCTRCRENPVLVSTDKVIPLFSYRLWNKELMYRWKSMDERMFSPMFAKAINGVLNAAGEKVIVPVPPRKGKIRKKGWDQIEELCVFLEKRYSFTVLRLLERKTKKQQKKLSRSERLETIKNSYTLCSQSVLNRVLKNFSGKIPEKVCLIDDVCTTGATLESCAEILKSAGVKTVDAVTLFTVD